MPKKMRMTLPKKEEDLQKVVEEVMETHPDMHHHEHEHVHELDDILHTIDVLMDAMNTRLIELEEKANTLYHEVLDLYRLFAIVVKALASETLEERRKILLEADTILSEKIKKSTVEDKTV